MDNEKYGIELELVTNKFKEKMQQIKSSFSSLTDKKININANTAQLDYLKYQISEITEKLQNTQKFGLKFGDTVKLEAQLEKLTNQYNKLIGKQRELSTSSALTNANLTKGLDRMTSKIKRFGLALLSIRSIYALVSRASSAYLAQDTELANKLQSAWIGLGSVLAPIINFIATLILKVVSVINGFIKALTGVDLIAKASAKSMKGAAGSANSLKKALAGFDELQNLDTDAAGGGGLGAGWTDPFATIDEDWGKAVANIIKGVDTFRTNIVKKMRQSMEDAKKMLKIVGFSDAFIDMYDLAANGAISVMEGFLNSFKGIIMIFDGILSADKDRIIEGFKTLGKGLWDIITGLIQTVVGAIGMVIVEITDLLWKGASWIYNNIILPVDGWIENKIRRPAKEKFADLWNSIKNGASSAWNWVISQLNGARNNFRTFINTIASWFSSLWSSVLRGFASIWNKVADTANKVGGKLGMTTLPRINSYAVGTNYVPEDQLAFIHKGEAVVPKKYNTGSYQPVNNDETNYLLEQVINAINGIEINPYTTIKDVGKASLNYINNKSRQLGESVVV